MPTRLPNWVTSLAAVAAVVAFAWTILSIPPEPRPAGFRDRDGRTWERAPLVTENDFHRRVQRDLVAGELVEVVDLCRRINQMYPAFRPAHRYRAIALERLNEPEEAAESWNRLRTFSTPDPEARHTKREAEGLLYHQAWAAWGLGEREEARAMFLDLARRYTTAERIAWAEAGRTSDRAFHAFNAACYWSMAGETGRALESLELALQLGFGQLPWVEADPDLDPIRDDPEYERLIEEARQAEENPPPATAQNAEGPTPLLIP